MEGLRKLTCKCSGHWPPCSRQPRRGTCPGIRAGAGWSEHQSRVSPKNWPELTDKLNEGNGLWRVNGRARITTDAALCASFTVEGKPARSVTIVDVDSVYFQCARAIVRSELWNPAKHVDPKSLPTPGKILEVTSRKNIDAETYDKEWPERAKKTMW